MVYLELVMSLLDFFTSNTPWYFLDFALQIVGIPLGTNHTVYCTRFIFYCKERDFMSNLKKYKLLEHYDKLNDGSDKNETKQIIFKTKENM